MPTWYLNIQYCIFYWMNQVLDTLRFSSASKSHCSSLESLLNLAHSCILGLKETVALFILQLAENWFRARAFEDLPRSMGSCPWDPKVPSALPGFKKCTYLWWHPPKENIKKKKKPFLAFAAQLLTSSALCLTERCGHLLKHNSRVLKVITPQPLISRLPQNVMIPREMMTNWKKQKTKNDKTKQKSKQPCLFLNFTHVKSQIGQNFNFHWTQTRAN